MGDDPDVHRAILAYASDMMLLGTSMLPHAVNWAAGRVQTASLDHALWLHEPFRVDEWLLYVTNSPWRAMRAVSTAGRYSAATAGWWRASRRRD